MTGAPHPFLAEHLALGLPTVTELERLAAAVGGELRFHGDFRRTTPRSERRCSPATGRGRAPCGATAASASVAARRVSS